MSPYTRPFRSVSGKWGNWPGDTNAASAIMAAGMGREASMTYEVRYCAFVDILGFSELIAGLRNSGRVLYHSRGAQKDLHPA